MANASGCRLWDRGMEHAHSLVLEWAGWLYMQGSDAHRNTAARFRVRTFPLGFRRTLSYPTALILNQPPQGRPSGLWTSRITFGSRRGGNRKRWHWLYFQFFENHCVIVFFISMGITLHQIFKLFIIVAYLLMLCLFKFDGCNILLRKKK